MIQNDNQFYFKENLESFKQNNFIFLFILTAEIYKIALFNSKT